MKVTVSKDNEQTDSMKVTVINSELRPEYYPADSLPLLDTEQINPPTFPRFQRTFINRMTYHHWTVPTRKGPVKHGAYLLLCVAVKFPAAYCVWSDYSK